jgi:hypothetical protein
MSKTNGRAPLPSEQRQEFRRGFPLVEARDSKALEPERRFLQTVNRRPHSWQRWQGYWTLTGPGWVQSALTLEAGSAGSTILLGQLGAAVGVNMTFLYPYTLLARGWSREHLRLKNFDLCLSMFLPFVLATSFVTMACANTLYIKGIRVKDAVDAAHALQPLAGLTLGRIVFSLGILSMCFTTMVIEMLIAGFVLSEMFRFELHGKAYRASTGLANLGLLGAFTTVPFWVPVVASSFNLLMIPVTYLCFFVLQNKRSYLGEEVNKGVKGAVWNILLVLAVLVVAAGAAAKILSL